MSPALHGRSPTFLVALVGVSLVANILLAIFYLRGPGTAGASSSEIATPRVSPGPGPGVAREEKTADGSPLPTSGEDGCSSRLTILRQAVQSLQSRYLQRATPADSYQSDASEHHAVPPALQSAVTESLRTGPLGDITNRAVVDCKAWSCRVTVVGPSTEPAADWQLALQKSPGVRTLVDTFEPGPSVSLEVANGPPDVRSSLFLHLRRSAETP
jgi:uncharacterized membrane protein